MIAIRRRAAAIARGKRAMQRLEEHPRTSRPQLGAAREILNRLYTHSDPTTVRAAVEAIETIVTDLYAAQGGKD